MLLDVVDRDDGRILPDHNFLQSVGRDRLGTPGIFNPPSKLNVRRGRYILRSHEERHAGKDERQLLQQGIGDPALATPEIVGEFASKLGVTRLLEVVVVATIGRP